MTRGARHCRFSSLRSRRLAARLVPPALDQHVEHHPVLVHGTPQPVLHTGDLDGHLVEVPLVASTGQPPPDSVDRKSTRLNSSHANISYAVFCLKKKKKKHPQTL